MASPGNWAPRVIATTWKLLIEKALGNLLLTYLMCLTKGKKQTKPGGLVSNPSLYSVWPVEKQCFLSQFNPFFLSLTLDCLSLGRSQWALTSLTSGQCLGGVPQKATDASVMGLSYGFQQRAVCYVMSQDALLLYWGQLKNPCRPQNIDPPMRNPPTPSLLLKGECSSFLAEGCLL